MKYGLEPNTSLQSQVKECMEFNQKLISDLEEMKKQRDEAKRELNNTQLTLREALDELKITTTLILATQKQVSSVEQWFESSVSDYNKKFMEQSVAFSAVLSSLEKEISGSSS